MKKNLYVVTGQARQEGQTEGREGQKWPCLTAKWATASAGEKNGAGDGKMVKLKGVVK